MQNTSMQSRHHRFYAPSSRGCPPGLITALFSPAKAGVYATVHEYDSFHPFLSMDKRIPPTADSTFQLLFAYKFDLHAAAVEVGLFPKIRPPTGVNKEHNTEEAPLVSR